MTETLTFGKDKVVFVPESELAKPSSIILPEEEEPRGFLLSNGEINWSCPCLGSMVIGPCNIEFRESITCFHNSSTDPKGADCIDKFRELNDCMGKFPELYPKDDFDDDSKEELEQLALNQENEKITPDVPSVEDIDISLEAGKIEKPVVES